MLFPDRAADSLGVSAFEGRHRPHFDGALDRQFSYCARVGNRLLDEGLRRALLGSGFDCAAGNHEDCEQSGQQSGKAGTLIGKVAFGSPGMHADPYSTASGTHALDCISSNVPVTPAANR